jgi:phosphoribosyl-AMP cyclohydrolase
MSKSTTPNKTTTDLATIAELNALDAAAMPAWISHLKFDEHGLIPAIAQDYQTNKVLMVAWMNPQALMMTVARKQAVYFSRSRQQLWHKGEESGHTQTVHSVRTDCDGDVILLSVEQRCHIACHTGREACFFYELSDNAQWQIVEPVMKNPELMYGSHKTA